MQTYEIQNNNNLNAEMITKFKLPCKVMEFWKVKEKFRHVLQNSAIEDIKAKKKIAIKRSKTETKN